MSICNRASVGSAGDKHTQDPINSSRGFYKGTKVATRNIQCGPVTLTRDNLMELKTVKGKVIPDSKAHGANMGPTGVLSASDGPRVCHMNLAIRGWLEYIPVVHLLIAVYLQLKRGDISLVAFRIILRIYDNTIRLVISADFLVQWKTKTYGKNRIIIIECNWFFLSFQLVVNVAIKALPSSDTRYESR